MLECVEILIKQGIVLFNMNRNTNTNNGATFIRYKNATKHHIHWTREIYEVKKKTQLL